MPDPEKNTCDGCGAEKAPKYLTANLFGDLLCEDCLFEDGIDDEEDCDDDIFEDDDEEDLFIGDDDDD